MALPQKVRIVEVGPRDGLQNEAQAVPTQIKVALIERLVAAGCTTRGGDLFRVAEMGPQMADTMRTSCAA